MTKKQIAELTEEIIASRMDQQNITYAIEDLQDKIQGCKNRRIAAINREENARAALVDKGIHVAEEDLTALLNDLNINKQS